MAHTSCKQKTSSSMQVGVGAAAALAVTSFCVDLSGGKLIGNGLFNDGATLPVPTHPTPIERGA